jgi:hypothetical protein
MAAEVAAGTNYVTLGGWTRDFRTALECIRSLSPGALARVRPGAHVVGGRARRDARLRRPLWTYGGVRRLGPGFVAERAERLRFVLAQRARPIRERMVDRTVLAHQPGEVPEPVLDDLREMDLQGRAGRVSTC